MSILVKLIGTNLKTSSIFKDFNGLEIFPDSVTLKYKKPDNSVVSVNITPINNKYYSIILLDMVGTWYIRWECSGEYASAEEFDVTVTASKVV